MRTCGARHQSCATVLGTQLRLAEARQEVAEAATFEDLRDRAIELAKEGLRSAASRDLGEMNTSSCGRRDGSARRMLIRVDVEDASALISGSHA